MRGGIPWIWERGARETSQEGESTIFVYSVDRSRNQKLNIFHILSNLRHPHISVSLYEYNASSRQIAAPIESSAQPQNGCS